MWRGRLRCQPFALEIRRIAHGVKGKYDTGHCGVRACTTGVGVSAAGDDFVGAGGRSGSRWGFPLFYRITRPRVPVSGCGFVSATAPAQTGRSRLGWLLSRARRGPRLFRGLRLRGAARERPAVWPWHLRGAGAPGCGFAAPDAGRQDAFAPGATSDSGMTRGARRAWSASEEQAARRDTAPCAERRAGPRK